jgi:hypothetical protein
MTTELKTLKDFNKIEDMRCKENMCDADWRKELKSEAIKWVKWIDENTNPKELYEELKSSEEAYSTVIDKEELRKRDMQKVWETIRERDTIKTWIEHFFNLTTESKNEL